MERLTMYRELIISWLSEQSKVPPVNGDIEMQTIFDREQDRYLLVALGWDGDRRFYSCLFHLEIKNGKIWIQRNETDWLITPDLLKKGVAKEDIVLGLQPSYVRNYTKAEVA